MLLYGDFSVKDWALLWFTGAYGGVRIVSQFALLVHTSATTLALSNVTIQALTTILGIFLFGTPVTNFLVAGVSVTLLTTTGYTGYSLPPSPWASVAASCPLLLGCTAPPAPSLALAALPLAPSAAPV